MLSAPENGKIKGSCDRPYGSTCTFECDEGWELSGSETRQCNITEQNIMYWTGTTATCSGMSTQSEFN